MNNESDRVRRLHPQAWRNPADSDPGGPGVIGKVHRIATLLEKELRPVYADAQLSQGEFELLTALRQSGEPFELTPGQLASRTLISSGAVTKQVDRLIVAGWVTRSVSEGDGRVRRVALTLSGKVLIDRVAYQHVTHEERLLESLSELDRARLSGLLARWARDLGA